MNLVAIRSLYDETVRCGPAFPGARREERGRPRTICAIADDGSWSSIVFSELNHRNAAGAIAREVALARQRGGSCEWKYYSYDKPPNLPELLVAHGFVADEPEQLMVLELASAPAQVREPPRAEVHRIHDPDELSALEAIELAVWGEVRTGLRRELAHLLREHPESMAIYLAYDDGRPAAAGWINFSPGVPFAGLWGGSTVPSARGKGLYGALVAARAQEAIRRDVAYLTIDAGPMSAPIAAHYGFQLLAITIPFNLGPAEEGG